MIDPIVLRPEDRAAEPRDDEPVAAPASREVVPRSARARFIKIANGLTEHQDVLTEMFNHVTSQQGRALLRTAYSETETLIRLTMKSADAVEQG